AVALLLIPPLALWLFPMGRGRIGRAVNAFIERRKSVRLGLPYLLNAIVIMIVASVLSGHWEPLGAERGGAVNLVFVLLAIFGLLGGFWLFQKVYEPILRWCLNHKLAFLCLPALLMVFAVTSWIGFAKTFAFVPRALENWGVQAGTLESSAPWVWARHTFPGLQKKFIPDLDEGSFLLMPTTMPHASIGEALDVVRKLDLAIESIPEVRSAVGKIGRVESALDPAPISMVETIIEYEPEYKSDSQGRRLNFRYDRETERYVLDENKQLIPDEDGRPFRNWRPEVRTSQDIWDLISEAAQLTGTVPAPKLQPIAARIVMLQSGMRAPMGVKVKGPSLEAIESVGFQIEQLLKQIPSIKTKTT
ncbi:MAG: efflux RND transporter permease subunit, partial [Planctomycetes bacterium]|nr:efflux RND transporter permease subunit [Planctomycetota bacterium]